MANKVLSGSRLQLVFANETGTGANATKSMSISRIRTDATTDQYYNAALALGDLCSLPLQSVRMIDTSALTD